MPTVEFLNEGKKIKCGQYANLRKVALLHDVEVYKGIERLANCHGNGLCGTDRVVVSPSTSINPLTLREKFLLRKELKKNPNIRLACQVRVYGDATVETVCGKGYLTTK